MSSDTAPEKPRPKDQWRAFLKNVVIYGGPLLGLAFVIGCGGNEVTNPQTSTIKPLVEPAPTDTPRPGDMYTLDTGPQPTETPLTWETSMPRETPFHETAVAMKTRSVDDSFVPEGKYTQEIFDKVKENLVLIKLKDDFGQPKVETASIAQHPDGKTHFATIRHDNQIGPKEITVFYPKSHRKFTVPVDEFIPDQEDQADISLKHDPESYNLPNGLQGINIELKIGTKLMVVGFPADLFKEPFNDSDESLLNAQIAGEVVEVVESWTPEKPNSITVKGLSNYGGSGSVVVYVDEATGKEYRVGVVYGVNEEEVGHLSNQPQYVIFFFPNNIENLIDTRNELTTAKSNP